MKSNEELIPRPGSPLYSLNLDNEEEKKKTLKKWRLLNKYLILPLYRSRILPLFGFGRIFLILTTKGRTTGKNRRTPLEYHRIDGIITVFSSRGEDAGWMKNIRANPEDLMVRYGFRHFKPQVEIVGNTDEKLRIIKWYLVNHGRSSKMLFGWNPKTDDPETTDYTKLLEMLTILRLHRKIK